MTQSLVEGLVVTYIKGDGDYWLKGIDWWGRILKKGMAVGQTWQVTKCSPDVWKEIAKETKYKSVINIPQTLEKVIERYSSL